jgi:FAD binding domain-containing protein
MRALVADFSELSIRGRIAVPEDSDWDEARQPWNLAADQRPAAVALVESADDVVKVVGFARDNDLKMAGQGTGHGAVPLGALDDAILIKTSRMRRIDVSGDSARVEAGVLAEEIGGAAHEKGRSWLPGTSPNVGVTGYSLGGGLSWLGRKYGWACNSISAIELVGADGEPRTVDAGSDPDLFWALRGGGGGYAIVTALHLDLVPVTEAYAGSILFPPEHTAEGLRRYRDWAAEAPEEVSSLVRMLNLPPIPDIPEEIRGKKWFAITACFLGSKEDGEKLMAPLREIGEPVMDMFDQVPTPALSRIAMDPEPPVPGLGHHATLSELPDECLDAIMAASGPETDSPLLQTEIRQLGGALGRPAENGGALNKLDAEFVLFGVGMLMDPAMHDPLEGSLDTLVDAIKPWRAEGGYFNYAERTCDVDAILPAETCERLAHVKRSWDPENRILANHQLALAAA